MKVLLLIALVFLIGNITTMATHEGGARRYQQIASVDKRVPNLTPYVMYVVEFDTEAEIAIECGSYDSNFTRRGCTFNYEYQGLSVYRVIVLSDDYVVLRHELEHVSYGPCHVDSAGPTPKQCQEWLIKNKLVPIGTQVLTINQQEEK